MLMPLHYVKNWSPFKIDALGLITILGADQVDRSVGRLVRSRYTEYLPLLGAYVIADGQFTQPMPGFALYSIKSCMTSTDLAGWFTRWVSAQDFQDATGKVVWTYDEGDKSTSRTRSYDILIAAFIGFVALGVPLAFTALLGDWWGLASAVTMLVSVLVRAELLTQNRGALDVTAEKAVVAATKQKAATESSDTAIEPGDAAAKNLNVTVEKTASNASRHPDADIEKTLVVLSNGKAITMYLPKELIPCFIGRPKIQNHHLYLAVRYIGWLAFGGQIITIGMSALASQIVMLVVIIGSTWLTVFHNAANDNVLGSRLFAKCNPHPGPVGAYDPRKRQAAYIELNMSPKEEEYMINWALMPSRDNEPWWEGYRRAKAEYAEIARPPKKWATV